MNRNDRRQQLAFLLCGGLAGVLAGGYPGEAAAQVVPLRVDPALLGLPPAAPRSPPAVPKSPPAVVTPPEAEDSAKVQPSAPVELAGGVASEAPEAAKVSSARPEAAAASGARGIQSDPALPPAVPPRRETEALAVQEPVRGSVIMPNPSAPLPPASAQSVSETDEKNEDEHEDAPDRGPALVLRAASKMAPLPRDAAAPRPAFLSALRMVGEIDREFVAEGEAELRKTDYIVNSDLMTYWPLEDEIEAEGRVRLQQGEDVMTGPKMRLRMEDRIGYFDQPFYQIQHQSLMGGQRVSERKESDRRVESLLGGGAAWNSGFATRQSTKFVPGQTQFDDKVELSTTTQSRGEAERIDFEGENQYRLRNNTFTTCPVDNDAWYLRTNELKLDYDHEVGEGKSATVYFKDVPILYTPWLSFSLNNERKSGFLPPSFGVNSDNGFEYEQAYYWNIAPNIDATLSPRAMARRGVQLGGDFRYLNTALGGIYRGDLKVEYLPGDRLRDNDRRHAFSLVHEQTTNSGFSGTINYSKVSDDNYYTDLSSEITTTSQTQVLQQGVLNYSGGWWSASANFQQYQTLQPDKDNPVLEQYRMLPQLVFNARKPDFHGTDVNFLGQYTHFTIREQQQFGSIFPDGNRSVLYPQISLPYETPGWYVTPKFGVNYRHYSLSGQADGISDSISTTLPVFSLDSGMTFERSSRWFGRDYTQTLEPRLYYLNIPHKDQSNIPLFDTGPADFNFAQVFSENQFSGWDRVNNANQLTAALTSRLIEPETGSEIMRATIGQRFHFTRNKVTLSGTPISSDDEKWSRSNFLAGFNGQILPKVYADAAWEFNPNSRKTERLSAGMRYQPEPGKVLNAAYRYNRAEWSPVNQVDISGQWPLWGRWHGVGRLNYSFKDDGTVLSAGGQNGRIVESIAGLEYNGGCWILRGVIRRKALTSEDASTAFYIQLELSGLGRIGSNPLSLLKRDIQGYGLIGSNSSESVFGNY
ncbi:MAG: LPS assembly protein LptD [Candidatus Accumulibacter sp.]|jgi:LPS-assembly protein|nr:LPS assembly protein LptD [Accumulibacter sp.]